VPRNVVHVRSRGFEACEMQTAQQVFDEQDERLASNRGDAHNRPKQCIFLEETAPKNALNERNSIFR
jgi:hypothetical protein